MDEPEYPKTPYGVQIRPFRHNARVFAPKPLKIRALKPVPEPKLSLDALLALVQGRAEDAPIIAPLPTGGGLVALIGEWARYFGIQPGVNSAGTSSDLYRHFLAWCNGEAGLPPEGVGGAYGGLITMSRSPPNEWRRMVRKLGLTWKNARRGGGPEKLIHLQVLPAKYIRQWVEMNKSGFGPNPWARSGKKQAAETMPANLEELLAQVRTTPAPEIKTPPVSLLGLDDPED